MNWIQIIIAVIAYLLGMAFAGSFIGRKWMGTVDIILHRLFRRKTTIAQYLYWRYFCGIDNPPQPEGLRKLRKTIDVLMSTLTHLGRLSTHKREEGS